MKCRETPGGEPPGAEKRASYEARLAEGIESASGRIGFRVADDDVVEEFDVEDACGFAELARYLDVSRTRGRIAGGMVVLCGEPSYVECGLAFHSGLALRVGWIAAHS